MSVSAHSQAKRPDHYYDRSTGTFKKNTAKDFNAMEWWKRKLFGLSPRPLRERKRDVDSAVKQATE